MATKKPAATGATTVRVLVDFSLGKVDDVIELDGSILEQALAAGLVDSSPAAVEHAATLAR